jgi:hypothetical protein
MLHMSWRIRERGEDRQQEASRIWFWAVHAITLDALPVLRRKGP